MLKYGFVILISCMIVSCDKFKVDNASNSLCDDDNYIKVSKSLNYSRCLNLPVKYDDFKSIDKLNNGQIDLLNTKLPSVVGTKFYSEYDYDVARILGYIPLNNNIFFLVVIRNVEMEGDGFGQVVDLIKVKTQNMEVVEGGLHYIGYNKVLYEEFIDDEIINGSFKNIENKESYGTCIKKFNIQKNWIVDTVLECVHSEDEYMNYKKETQYNLN